MSQSGPPADAKQAQAVALQELEAAQRRKRAIDTSLANLEASIFAFEGSYLEETAQSGGNIIKGFDNYLKPPASGTNKKKPDVGEADRLFSTSSGTFQQSLDAKRQYELEQMALRHHSMYGSSGMVLGNQYLQTDIRYGYSNSALPMQTAASNTLPLRTQYSQQSGVGLVTPSLPYGLSFPGGQQQSVIANTGLSKGSVQGGVDNTVEGLKISLGPQVSEGDTYQSLSANADGINPVTTSVPLTTSQQTSVTGSNPHIPQTQSLPMPTTFNTSTESEGEMIIVEEGGARATVVAVADDQSQATLMEQYLDDPDDSSSTINVDTTGGSGIGIKGQKKGKSSTGSELGVRKGQKIHGGGAR